MKKHSFSSTTATASLALISAALLPLAMTSPANGHATSGPFEQAIPQNPVLHSQSSSLVRSTFTSTPSATTEFGTAVYRAKSTDPLCEVTFTENWGTPWTEKIRVPSHAVPTGSRSADPWGDHWLNVRYNGYQYDLWIFNHWDGSLCTNGKQLAHWGGKFPFPGALLDALSGGGGGGAGVSVAAGTPRRAEILNDSIDHALAFAVENAGPQHKYPANKSDGDCWGGVPSCVKEGQRFYLDVSDAQVNAIANPYQRAIARAAQQYGMYVTDQTGGLNIPLEQRAADLIPNYTSLNQIPWGSMRALKCADGTATCIE